MYKRERLNVMKKKNKQLRNLLIFISVVVTVVAIFGSVVFVDSTINERPAKDLSISDAQALIDDTFKALPKNYAGAALLVNEKTSITVKGVRKGDNRELILDCEYTTVNVYNAIEQNIDEILGSVELVNPGTGLHKNATLIMSDLLKSGAFNKIINEAEPTAPASIEIRVYETVNDGFKVHTSDDVVNAVYGDLPKIKKLIENTNEIVINGKTVDISKENNLRTGANYLIELEYENEKPDTATFVGRTWNEFKDDFYDNFIKENRWMYLVKGLGTTLGITALSLVLGVVIGVIVAVVRFTYAKTGKLGFLDKICGVYLSIMRGTPVMIQLMIIYFVLLLPIGIEKFPAAVICFGINSGAYVAEIIRGGIMAVDDGQTEAGRSLGLGYVSTMWYIVVPQAFKAILPALANEFITLLKETSVAFYIGVADLTQGGLKIRSLTFSNFMPLIAVALIYLVLVLGLSYLVSLLERRLRKSDRR